MMTLLGECIEALSNDAKILTKEESETITKELQAVFPFSNMGRIVWEDYWQPLMIVLTQTFI